MGETKPAGPYADEMTSDGGWPELDEDSLFNRARELETLLVSLTDALDDWRSRQANIFSGENMWFGDASNMANGEVDNRGKSIRTHQQQTEDAKKWCEKAGYRIRLIKAIITKNVTDAQREIRDVNNDESLTVEDRGTRIQQIVDETRRSNQNLICHAAQEHGSKEPPALPPPAESGGAEGRGDTARPDPPPLPAPTAGTPHTGDLYAGSPPRSSGGGPPPTVPAAPFKNTGETVPAPGPAERESSGTAGPSDVPASQSSPATPGAPSGPAVSSPTPTSPTTSTPSIASTKDLADKKGDTADITGVNSSKDPLEAFTQGMGQKPAAAAPQILVEQPKLSTQSPPSAAAPTSTSSGTSSAGAGVPAAPVPASPPLGSLAAGPPTPPTPLGPPVSPPPAAPAPPSAGGAGSAPVLPTSAGAASSNNNAAPAPVPVSAARAERDAIATATTAGALRRLEGISPLIVARRVAAALAVSSEGFGFFWATGLTVDGTIVVANSYGLAYVPDGVQIPENIIMATADSAIAVADRATWATYPILAVEGWARFQDKQLRMVIGTENQLKNSDPGAAKVYLQPDDLPADGEMQGRDRLAVVAKPLSQRLIGTDDAALNNLLPLAPVDDTAPEDRTSKLLFDAAKPLMSSMASRGVAHLKAWLVYVDHRAELALYAAHHASEAAATRAAIADWAYWQYLGDLVNEALAVGASS